MNRILIPTILLTAGLFLYQTQVTAQNVSSDTEEKLLQLIEDVEKFRGQDRSLTVPEGTDKRYSDRLPAISKDYYLDRAREAEAFLERLKAIDRSAFETDLQLDAAILERQLQNRIANAEFRPYLIPVGVAGGFHISLARYARVSPSSLEERFCSLAFFGKTD